MAEDMKLVIIEAALFITRLIILKEEKHVLKWHWKPYISNKNDENNVITCPEGLRWWLNMLMNKSRCKADIDNFIELLIID